MTSATTTDNGPQGQPDIAYTPNYETYLERVQRRRESEILSQTLPPGFPSRLESDLVWDGSSVSDHYRWAYVLGEAELTEIHQALEHFKSLERPLGEISQETFPLPALHSSLRSVSEEIHVGHGFKVIRGIPVHQYDRSENIIIFAGLASHIAPTRGRQDHTYNDQPADVVLTHIKDLTGQVDAGQIGAPAYTTEKQVFHTDIGDVIALFALEAAEEGGESYLSSSWAVYNELAETRPDLVRTLAESWDFDNFGKSGTAGYTSRPLLHYQPSQGHVPERLIIQYARRAFTGYWGLPRSANIPPITEAQAEALDALHFLAEKHMVALAFQPGDVQFVNNLGILHARGGFKNSPEKQRHLMRLWLRDEELAWETPAALQDRWGSVYQGVRDENQLFPLEPFVRSASHGGQR